MGIGIPQSTYSPGSWWSWPPNTCGAFYDPWDWWLAIEGVETDPDTY